MSENDFYLLLFAVIAAMFVMYIYITTIQISNGRHINKINEKIYD
ncbi:MAG: hypothetical protein PVI43_01245 [Candidatus Bathyarchaeota archaeon]|jgi:hypothetical protein